MCWSIASNRPLSPAGPPGKGPHKRSPLIERAFEHLRATWPEETSTVVSWGDSRIGNVMYDGFEPCAILDWEMAGLGPRELDLGWLAFMHCFFQKLFEGMGLEGLPDFLRPDDLAVCTATAILAPRRG